MNEFILLFPKWNTKCTEDELDLNSMKNGTERETGCAFFSQKNQTYFIFRQFYKVGYEEKVMWAASSE